MRRIVIIGSGFAGMRVAQELASQISGRRGLRITVVTDQSHFLFTPLWSAVAAGSSRLSQVAMPVRSLLDSDIDVVLDRVVSLNLTDRNVVAERSTHDYDFLVVAVGAATDWGAHPEFEHYALPCRSGRDAVDAYDAVDRAFEAASQAADAATRRRLLTFVIVGAGITGVELAAHMASRFESQVGEGLDAELASIARIVLIERESTILPGVDDELRQPVLEHLRGAGVELRVGETVIGCNAERVDLHSEDAIGCGTIFWCGGVRCPGWLADAGFETDADARIVVHRHLQAVSHHGVYAAGDVASCGDGVPMTADVAVQHAEIVARNIIADLAGRSRKDWSYEPGGTYISLGQANAVARYRGVVVVGRAAQALAGAMTTRLLPQGVRGLVLVRDLFAGAFASRAAGAHKWGGLLER